MYIRMNATAASPERILHAGKTYNVPRSVGQPLIPYGTANNPLFSLLRETWKTQAIAAVATNLA